MSITSGNGPSWGLSKKLFTSGNVGSTAAEEQKPMGCRIFGPTLHVMHELIDQEKRIGHTEKVRIEKDSASKFKNFNSHKF